MNPHSRRAFLKSGIAIATVAATQTSILSMSPSRTGRATPDENKFLEAIRNGDQQTVQKMLTSDPKLVNAHDANGKSGYVLAVLGEHSEIANLLLQAGFQTDLHESALGLNWDRFEKLAAAEGDNISATINGHHPIGGSAMHAAAIGGASTDIWRVYAKCGQPNAFSDQADLTPLQAALRHRDFEIAELTAYTLLSNSADPNAVARTDASPLHIATERGSADIVEMLIRLGARVEAKNGKGQTSLEIARANQDKSITKMLENHREIPRTNLTWRASVNRNGDQYAEPEWDGLPDQSRGNFVGSSHGNLANVQKMLSQDKRFAHSISTTGERAVEAAAHTGNQKIAEKLLTVGAPYSLPTAVMMSDIETVKRWLDEEPGRIHERGAHDFPLLYYPIIGKCKLEMLQLLLDRGGKVEQQNLLGTTALHFACMRDDIESVELLISHGADVKRVGRKFGGRKQTPLQLSRDPKIIDMLKSNGA
ncbi:ankyrin repeat domain-containing protein [bacterium]|nr:ankyrin repeat domain-containing protein [bacterium]